MAAAGDSTGRRSQEKSQGKRSAKKKSAARRLLGVAVNGAFGAVKLYFDPTTHLLAAARYQSATDHGPSDNEQHWSDYRNVEGRQFAFATDTYRDGAKLFESTVQTVQRKSETGRRAIREASRSAAP